MYNTRAGAVNYMIDKHILINCNYLEIGVFQGTTLKNINASVRDGVDPEDYCSSEYVNYKMTSDKFFESHVDKKYDVIFIDGLHTAIQAAKDLKNSLKHIKEGGIILFDDVYPHNEYEQRAFDPSNTGANTGDCWKTVCYYFEYLKNISDDIVFFPDVDRGMLAFKLKPGDHTISIPASMPVENNGVGNEWSRYTYKNDYQNFFDKMVIYRVQ